MAMDTRGVARRGGRGRRDVPEHGGKQRRPASRRGRPAAAPRQQFHGHGTWDNDRPPPSRPTRRRPAAGCGCWWPAMATGPPWRDGREFERPGGGDAYTDESHGYRHVAEAGRGHATVCHKRKEWARDDDGDGVREVHDNTLEGLWTWVEELGDLPGRQQDLPAPIRRHSSCGNTTRSGPPEFSGSSWEPVCHRLPDMEFKFFPGPSRKAASSGSSSEVHSTHQCQLRMHRGASVLPAVLRERSLDHQSRPGVVELERSRRSASQLPSAAGR